MRRPRSNWRRHSRFIVTPPLIAGQGGMGVDDEGNLYTAEVIGGRAQKFRPKPGADPEKLIGSFLGFPPL